MQNAVSCDTPGLLTDQENLQRLQIAFKGGNILDVDELNAAGVKSGLERG